MLMRFSAVVLVLVLCTVTRSEGVKCYTCNSIADWDNCGDPFKSANNATSCAQCVKTKSEVNGQNIVVRTCKSVATGSIGCKKTEFNGNPGEECYCTGDLCNMSSRVTFSMMRCIAAGALLFLFKTCF